MNLVKIGLPSAQAESVRFARKVQQVGEWREAAQARLNAEYYARMKAVVNEFVPDEVPAEPLAPAAGQ